MPRTFNIAGPNNPQIHYTLDPESRLPGLRTLIEEQNYFVVHAPRQTGKTTLLDTMARKLTAEGRYTAILFSIEASRPFSKNVAEAVMAALDSLQRTASAFLPEPLRPPDDLFQHVPNPSTGIAHVLSEWAKRSSRPLVVFIDEIDAIEEDALISVLHQLRDGYKLRPQNFPQSVALIGMRDVREYRARIRPARETLGSASPFNIKAESPTLENFTRDEVRALYHQHTEETGQQWTDEAISRAYELTMGQPWLVNALARQIVRNDVTDRSITITTTHVEAHIILSAWLQRVGNSGGHLDRESAIGAGRADLLIEWPVITDPSKRRWPIMPGVPVQREAMELKLYADNQTEAEGLEQLGRSLTRLGEKAGHLLIFDRRSGRNWDEKIFRRDDIILPTPFENLRATVWGF
jgi:hypothetical protein